MNQSFAIYSWHTDDPVYTKIAETHIKPSLDSLRLSYTITKVPPERDWVAATNLKPLVVKRILETTTESFVLVDCDAKVLQYPILFDNIDPKFDMAVYYLDKASWYQNGSSGKELCSGTLFFRNRRICHEVVDEWQRRLTPRRVEQLVLQDVLAENRHIKVMGLPKEYCWIDTLPDGSAPKVQPDGPIIINHYQASRTTRR